MGRARRGAHESGRAEIDVEIFDLGAPIAVDAVFQAGAGGPAYIGVGGRAGRLHRLDVTVGDSAGDIRQPAIKRVADPCARRADPALLGLALAAAIGGTDAPRAGSAALDAHPVGISFDAEHDGTGLPIVAELSADHSAGSIEISRIHANCRVTPTRLAPGVAAIDAGVEAGPTEWQLRRRLVVRRGIRSCREIGGLRRHRARNHARGDNPKRERAIHRSLPLTLESTRP